MKVSIAPEIFEKYGNISMGLVKASFEEPVLQETPSLQSLNEQAIQASLALIQQWGSIGEIPVVKARREIFKTMGASESKTSSVESLYGFIQEKGRLPKISPMVNLYNAISVLYGIPMGGYDCACIAQQKLTLRTAEKGEEFLAIGATEVEKTKHGEVIYADPEKVTCRYRNYKDSDPTKITSATKEILFMLDIAPEVPETLDEAMKMLQQLLKELGATPLSTAILNQKKKEAEL